MAAPQVPSIDRKRARAILGVSPNASPAELRRAFREAAKIAHPDRPSGDAERFREVVEAYRLLSEQAPADRIVQPPATVRKTAEESRILPITPLLAMMASCSPGITVVGIDNGFGAGCAAVRFLNRREERA